MEHNLHGITLFSVVIAALGFLFFTYDIFDRPHGILRWLIQVIVPGLIFALPWSILAFFLPAFLLLGPLSIKGIATNFAIYGGLIGFFNGLFTSPSDNAETAQGGKALAAAQPQQLPLLSGMDNVSVDLAHLVTKRKDEVQQSPFELGDSSSLKERLPALWKKLIGIWNRFLRDAVIGFVFASAFWFVETFLILGQPFYDFILNSLVQDYIGFAVVGLVGGSLWRFIHRPIHQPAAGLRPFALRYFLAGLVVWMVICLLVGLLSAPVFAFLWHTVFIVPFAVLVEFLLIALLGALASSFTGFALYKRAHSAFLFPRGLSSAVSHFPNAEGMSDDSFQQLEKRTAAGRPFPVLKVERLGIVPWLFIWLITGLGVFFIAQPVLAPLTEAKINLDTFDSTTYLNLFSQRFALTTLIGTALTLFIGSCATLLVQVISRGFLQAHLGKISKTTLLSPIQNVGHRNGVGIEQQTNSGLSRRFFSSMLDNLIRLALWYEIWFVFAIVLLLYFLFQNQNLAVIVIVGVAATALGGGLLRYLLSRMRRKKQMRWSDSHDFSLPRESLMKPIFWPLLWLAVWIMVTTTLLSQDDQTISSILDAAVRKIPFHLAQIVQTLGQRFLVEEQQINQRNRNGLDLRGFFPGGIKLDDPLTILAAIEAFVGLLVNVTFIATLTQRLFRKCLFEQSSIKTRGSPMSEQDGPQISAKQRRIHQTSKQNGIEAAVLQRPMNDDKVAWRVYWKNQGQPWRTKPEIDKERQKYLDERWSITPDIEKGIYPFKDIKLSRADIEWLLATHENGRGPVYWSNESQRERWGLDLRGADLCQENLHDLPLARLRGGLTWDEWLAATDEQRDMAGVKLVDAILFRAHLEGSRLRKAHLEGANLSLAHLEEAYLEEVHLERANLYRAHFEGANLGEAHLEYAVLYKTIFNADTSLENVSLGEAKLSTALLADVQWGNVNLANVNWSQVKMLGDERRARQQESDDRYFYFEWQQIRSGRKQLTIWRKSKDTRLDDYMSAVRANRQLAVALQAQGLNEVATHFAYRAQKLQRIVLRRQRKFGSYLFSGFLDMLAGYGYKPWRSFLAYLLVITMFATAYFIIGHSVGPSLSPIGAWVFSITSFHGRGFFPGGIRLDDPLTILAALEAFIGLLIEVTFIATLTQRLFGK